jgi:P4 family phage/plasmid primase-like protien
MHKKTRRTYREDEDYKIVTGNGESVIRTNELNEFISMYADLLKQNKAVKVCRQISNQLPLHVTIETIDAAPIDSIVAVCQNVATEVFNACECYVTKTYPVGPNHKITLLVHFTYNVNVNDYQYTFFPLVADKINELRIPHTEELICNTSDSCPLFGIAKEDALEKPIIVGKYMEYNKRVDVDINQLEEIISNVSFPTINHSISDKLRIPNAIFEKIYRAADIDTEPSEYIRHLVSCIDPDRAGILHEWLAIGGALRKIGKGSRHFFALWVDFSELYHNEKECLHEWLLPQDDDSDFFLENFAKLDDPENYEDYRDEENIQYIDQILESMSTQAIAHWMYFLYGSKYVCVDIGKNLWYRFHEHRWQLSLNGVDIQKEINNIKRDYLVTAKQNIIEITRDMTQSAGQHKLAHAKLESMNKFIECIEKITFRKNIMHECLTLFYDRDFSKKLNGNPYLICFKNGVYDLRTFKFRQGYPTDYLSLCTQYNYKMRSEYDLDIMIVEQHLQKIFPDRTLYEYFIDYAASLLRGGNFNKTFLIMTGSGDNGKSILIDLLKKALGDYARTFPTSLIVGGRRTQSSAATPELDKLEGVRYFIAQEPEPDDTINTGVVKELTGNDEMYVRGLYSEGRNVILMFKMALICNKLPKLSHNEQAIWNRIRVLAFESQFVRENECPNTLEEQRAQKKFPRDANLSNIIKEMKLYEALMHIMIERYKKTQGVVTDPHKVTESTAQYRSDSDIFIKFITECTIKQEGSTISSKTLFNEFKTWVSGLNSNNKVNITRNDLERYLSERMPKVFRNKILHNYAFVTTNEEIGE